MERIKYVLDNWGLRFQSFLRFWTTYNAVTTFVMVFHFLFQSFLRFWT